MCSHRRSRRRRRRRRRFRFRHPSWTRVSRKNEAPPGLLYAIGWHPHRVPSPPHRQTTKPPPHISFTPSVLTGSRWRALSAPRFSASLGCAPLQRRDVHATSASPLQRREVRRAHPTCDRFVHATSASPLQRREVRRAHPTCNRFNVAWRVGCPRSESAHDVGGARQL